MFRTELPLVPAPQQLPLSARVLTIGSCFSDTIGTRLVEAKVHASVNPFGTVFNPISACKLLRAAAGEDTDWQQHLVEARGRWQSYDLHATLGADSPVDLLQTLQQLLRDTGVFLATADTVILTLGSAWVYRLKETDELVSNCHKIPAEKFSKELLTPDEIINAVAETHAYLRLRNPKLRFVLTVSPVRHLKDTLPLNAVSKSVLRVACHYLSELLPDVSYFPAYELLLDDLRDYRFYAADMLHPSSVAEDYIWERFARTYFDADFGRFRKEWDAVRQALHHRPLYEAAPEHRQFLLGTLERLEKLANRADMRMEILEVRKRLESLPLPTPVAMPEPDDDDEERIDIGNETSAPLEVVTAETLPTTPETEVNDEPSDEQTVSEAELLAEAMTEAPLTKKRRRSRGGAKRNKKKHAARLAEETAIPADTEIPEATEAGLAPDSGAAVETTDSGIAASQLPPVAVLLDPTAPLQTALERRKRGSRRNRGRNKPTAEITTEDTVASTEAAIADSAEAVEPAPLMNAPETAPTDGLAPGSADVTPETAEPSPDTETVTPGTTPASSQRPARTGRSASEVRAAALRKPRRPDSRIKALYATPSAPQETAPATETTVAEQVSALSHSSGEPTLPAEVATAASSPVATATNPESSIEEPTAPATPVAAPKLPVVSAIPSVRGTGASGRLSASGQATLSARKATTDVPVPTQVERLTTVTAENQQPEVQQPEPQQPADTVSSALVGTTAAVEPVPTNEPVPSALPIATAPKKPRARPVKQKPQPADGLTEKPIPAKARPKAKKASTKPNEIAAEVPASADATTQPAVAPARRRKAAPKPDAAQETPPEKPKRAPRPSRRKPAAPGETPDAS